MRFLHFTITGFLVLTAALSFAADPPAPRNCGKIVIINDDGFSNFYSGKYRTADDLRKQISSFKDSQVGVFEWCIVTGSRVNFASPNHELPGEGMDEYPRRGDKLASETLQQLRDSGVDTLAVVAEACRNTGIACYASVRMNGDYSAGAWDGTLAKVFNSDFWHNHPEFHQHSTAGKPLTRLSYAFPEVREFKLSIIREAAARDISGINLDFQRHPNFFDHEAPMLEAYREKYDDNPLKVTSVDPRWDSIKAKFMTKFVADTRAILDQAGKQKGKRIGLSVRIGWEKYRTWGCDIETWIKNGWIDYLVVGQYGLGGYEFDISPFVEMAKGTGCAVLFGEECILDGHDTTAAEDKLIAEGKMKLKKRGTLSSAQHHERAARWYKAGADGVHLFNVGDRSVLKSIGNE
ncbi:MAG: family 10 glycosylhydrolase [Verrucomicrobiales bacterium]|nr:family 10 glycosylhydrolase [Verrucomicrobiales bacterium]